MKYLLLATILFSLKSFSQDCGSLVDGESLRVDEKNKSLEDFKVQDQDGIGSCYANSLSLLLQANLPSNPEVSYLHIASIAHTKILKEQISVTNKGKDFDIYAKPASGAAKAINGGGDALKWNLAMDGGDVCTSFNNIKQKESDTGKPSLCLKPNMNLERILNGNDPEHKQFKSILESSKYMNEFQKKYFGLDEKPTLFNSSRRKAIKEKYDEFVKSFDELISKKQVTLQNECKKINANSLDAELRPLVQTAISYSVCFKNDPTVTDQYWCKVSKGIVGNPIPQDDGSLKVESLNLKLLENLKTKILKRKTNFTSANLSEDLMDSIVEAADLKNDEVGIARDHMKKNFVNSSAIKKNLENLSNEYNEINEKGFSQACVNRNTFAYLVSNNFETDWKENPALCCSNAELMKQATNVIINYKSVGLNNLSSLMQFLTAKARDGYDDALISLYASDCDEKSKVSIPKSLLCQTINTNYVSKKDTTDEIIQVLKTNKPLSVSLCAEVLNKPKEEFTPDECGMHSVGLVGVQCIRGKIKYLIQNSWGANHKAKNPAIENIEGKGAYWFDETTFFSTNKGIEYLR